MLPLQFFGQNIHFAISLFASLVFFAVFWLYVDAWTSKSSRLKKDLFKWIGYLLVSISFLVSAIVVENSDSATSFFSNTAGTVATALRLVGYLIIIIGLMTDPLQPRPKTRSLEEELAGSRKTPAAAAAGSSFGMVFILPLGALAISFLYWRRAYKGLERHLKPVALAFILLFAFELLSLAGLERGTTNPTLLSLVKAFGPIWTAAHTVLLGASLVLGRWVWKYLTARFFSQLFIVFTSAIMAIFLITTISFTFLMMHNIQKDSLDNLATASNVLNYALNSKKAETTADAEAVAQNSKISQAIVSKDHKGLVTLTSDFLETKKQSSLVITSNYGQVLLRAENPQQWGDSISSDTLVRRALIGTNSSSLSTKDGVLAPLMYMKTTVPVRDSSKNIIGTASVGLVIDNAFIDGIKQSTGLDSAIYSGNVRSATTFVSPDGHSRWIGVKENSKQINSRVLFQGKSFKGEVDVLNRPFLVVYSPLKDADNSVVGMLLIGEPQSTILQTAERSIELTFLLAVILLGLATLPAFWVARYLTKQIG